MQNLATFSDILGPTLEFSQVSASHPAHSRIIQMTLEGLLASSSQRPWSGVSEAAVRKSLLSLSDTGSPGGRVAHSDLQPCEAHEPQSPNKAEGRGVGRPEKGWARKGGGAGEMSAE